MNVTVIGTGDMGQRHIRGWQEAGHKVISVVDADAERLQETASLFGIADTYTDYREAVKDSRVDVVSICLPLQFHAPVSIYAAECGKHVFCEKPLARSEEEAEAIEQAIRRAGVCFGIGFQRNLAGDVELLADWVRQGKLGRPLLFSGELLAEVRPKLAMHDRDGNNGPIVDACCHHFLLMRTLFQSRVKTVYALGRILARERPELSGVARLAVDTAVVTLEFESGDIGTMTVSWGLVKGNKMRPRPDRLIGPLGGVEAAGAGKLNWFAGERTEQIDFDAGGLHRKQFERFAEKLGRGDNGLEDLRIGREMLAVSLAALASIETGQPISLLTEGAGG